jgi:hypothetical protein
MLAYGRNQTLFEPGQGGCGLFRVRNRKWTPPANRPLAFEPSPEEAQTFKPIGDPVPKGCHHNPLSFRRRFMAPRKWSRLLRDHPSSGLDTSMQHANKFQSKTLRSS